LFTSVFQPGAGSGRAGPLAGLVLEDKVYLDSTAVLITSLLGIGWAGQVIAGFAIAWLGLVGIAILLVAAFPGHFVI
jgi:hypothetical protein